MMQERLQKILSAAGIASRRQAEILISSGRVSVNGKVTKELGAKAFAQKDVIRVDDRIISVETNHYYIALYKPPGYVTTMSDPQKRPTVADLVKDVPERVYPIGRLDYESSGLLLLTNDGGFAQKIQHPRHQIPKTYLVKISGYLNKKELRQTARGVSLPDGLFKPENLKVEKINDKSMWISLTLREGKNRIIRRGFAQTGHPVARLIRKSIGDITLTNLREGQWRNLTDREIHQLLNRPSISEGKIFLTITGK